VIGDGSLAISEIFGPTLQGEGPSAGRSAMFVRLGRCNLACAWCDTPYSWDRKRFDLDLELVKMSVDEVVEAVEQSPSRLVVITGGEPGLQVEAATSLARRLRAKGKSIELETNGTLPIDTLATECDLVVVSPKLANSLLQVAHRIQMSALKSLAARGNVVFKFVVTDVEEFDEIQALVDDVRIDPHAIWIMPEGTDSETISRRMRVLASEVARRGWSLSGRLQVQLWEGRRGR